MCRWWRWLSLLLLNWPPLRTEARKIADIYWNSSNPIFDISNTDHVKAVHLLDRVTIICPHPASPDQYEFSKLHVVSREEYDKCELREPRLLGSCVTPDRASSISIVFRDVSPIPGALEFHQGQSYFVVATSDGSHSGLNATAGGLCAAHNMRLKFDVLQTGEWAAAEAPLAIGSPGTAAPARVRDLGSRDIQQPQLLRGDSPVSSTISYVIHTVGPDPVWGDPRSASTTTRSSLITPLIVLLVVTGYF